MEDYSNGGMRGAETTRGDFYTHQPFGKVGADDKGSLINSLAVERQSVLGEFQQPRGVSATQSEYWDRPASKLRRLDSEPTTPTTRRKQMINETAKICFDTLGRFLLMVDLCGNFAWPSRNNQNHGRPWLASFVLAEV